MLVTDPGRAMNISDISDLANNREGTTEQSPVSFSALASCLQALKDAIKVDLPLSPKSRVVDPHECRDLSSQPVLGLDLGDTSQIAAVSSLKWSAMVDSENLRFGNVQDSLVRTKAKGLATASAEEYIPVGDIVVDNLQDAEMEGFPQQNLHQGGRGLSSYRGGHGVDSSAVASNQTTKSWAEVATMPSRSSIKLRYIPPPASDDPNVVDLPFREVGKLPFHYIRNSAVNMWKHLALKEVNTNGEGFIWKEIRHDNTVTCLAFWNDPINPKEFKYVFFAASSSLKGQNDKEKYEKSRMLKDDDEANTVGSCTLKVENVELEYYEWTGEQKLQYNDAPEDIEPEEIRPMGNYDVSITWPDGFTQWMKVRGVENVIPSRNSYLSCQM
ncbi:DNA topoisomerase 1 beta [Camellia lanceoleosa]|uniref:DNA topoisomerase 1 beta n=1 Tax=Camellia lanceoleosa TaxID=1840588 RepID=A0ACC0IYY6_9ERIC|nr:DNA topoisomerase 1 beta [Camellia lanceoleosa]